MNSVQVSLLVLGLVLVLGAYSGEAIECYVCNSHDTYEGEDCRHKDKLDRFLMNCTDYATKYNMPEFNDATKCRIQSQTVEGESRIIRSCAIEGRTDRCVERTGTKSVKITYCQCEGDGCNAASGVVASIITVTVAALLSRAFH